MHIILHRSHAPSTCSEIYVVLYALSLVCDYNLLGGQVISGAQLLHSSFVVLFGHVQHVSSGSQTKYKWIC